MLRCNFFKCDYSNCRGACCRGNGIVPLRKGERERIESMLPKLKSMLSSEAYDFIVNGGLRDTCIGTIKGKGCPFLVSDKSGHCAIQHLGIKDFPKPLSCHLFPLVQENGKLVYRPKTCCNAGVMLGFKEKVRLEDFLKDALVRAKKESKIASYEL